ncbi:hypothetical protein LXA43DRAFT_1182619 [Ganoderma leucocontextum]|nr:hypothetical protein LXA43DRAFT_1182619 [Ganoderma leucocontextum]
MPRPRQQSTPSDSDLDASVLSRTPSPEPPEHIPRPPNRFILYRAHVWTTRREEIERIHGVMTMGAFGTYIGPIWQDEPQDVKDYWGTKAEEAKREHMKKYPNYEFRPNRGSKGDHKPKRAPCKPRKAKSAERKTATLSPTQRTIETRSMAQQQQVAAARTGAQERKSMARASPAELTVEADVVQSEDVQVQNQSTSATMAQYIDQEPVQPRPIPGGEIFPSTAGLLPVGGGIFPPGVDLLSALVDPAFPAHWPAPDAFDSGNFAPSESESTEHDRPSLWDSDLPLFPPEIFEEGDYSGGHSDPETRTWGVPQNWGDWLAAEQPTFLPELGSDPLQPAVDPVLANWPTDGQYLGQHMGLFPEPGEWNA